MIAFSWEIAIAAPSEDGNPLCFESCPSGLAVKKRRIKEKPSQPTPSFGPPNAAATAQWSQQHTIAASTEQDDVQIQQGDEADADSGMIDSENNDN